MSDAGPAHSGRVLRSRAETPPLLEYLADVLQRRHFTWALATGQLRSQHLDTLLGNLWHVLNPVMLISVYYTVFGLLLDANRGVDNFIGFLAVGLFTFSFCQRTVIQCAGSIANNIGLIRSLQFPRAVLPIATVLVELMAYGFGFGVMIFVLLLTGELPQPSWLLAPVVIALFAMFSAGLGLAVARLTDTIRDVSQIVPYIFRLALYASGIIFSFQALVDSDLVANARLVRQLFILNPFFTYIDILRDVLMETYSAEFPVYEWIFMVVAAPVTLVLGIVFFRGGEKQYGRG